MPPPGYTEVLQENHYYPFGMNMDGPWRVPQGSDGENFYQYNGKDKDNDLGLDWYHYGARVYLPEIGRFTGVDPLAADFAEWSTYSYTFNNPILFIDPDGRSGESIHKDKDGNIIAEYDDGDNNVYVHNDLGGEGQHVDGMRSVVDQRREHYGNTSGGGEKAQWASAINKVSKFFEEGTQDAEAYHGSGDTQPGGLEVHMGADKNSTGTLKNPDAENGSSGIVDGLVVPAGGGASSAFGLPNTVSTIVNYHEGVGTQDKPWTGGTERTLPGDTVQCPSCSGAIIQDSSGGRFHPGKSVNVPDPTQYPLYNPKKNK